MQPWVGGTVEVIRLVDCRLNQVGGPYPAVIAHG